MRFFSTICLLVFFSASTAMALPMVFKPMKLPDATPSKKSETCTDFSGDWTGRCESSDGFVFLDTMKILLRNCSELIIDDSYQLEISGRRSLTKSTTAQTFTNITDLDWANPGKSELLVTGSWDTRPLTRAGGRRGSLKAQMKLVDGNLQFNQTMTEFEANPSQSHINCTFSRM